MEDISSMWNYLLGLFAAIVALVLLYRYFYQIDGFDSDPLAGRTPCDPSCSGFGHSKTTGRPCCHDAVGQLDPTSQADCPTGTTFDATSKRCLVCTKLGDGTTQCHSAGSYDAGTPDPKYHGSIDRETLKTDVLSRGAMIDYPDWVDDRATSSDIRGSGGESSFLKSHYTGNRKTISESDVDDTKDDLEDYYKETINERNVDDLDEDEDKYSEYKNKRKSIQDLINSKRYYNHNNSKIYDRFMERPSDMSYDDYEDEDDEAEGFASRL
jgi:hypothetical protein